jgi:hypothetical protein
VFERNRCEAPRRERDGVVSRTLLHGGDLRETQLTVTCVDVAPWFVPTPAQPWPGAGLLNSSGRSGPADLIRIPPETLHGIENLSDEVLTYVSAATPAIDWEAFYDTDLTQKASVRTDER